MALGLLLDIGAGGGTQKTELGFADRNWTGPPLAIASELLRCLFGPDHADGGGQQRVASCRGRTLRGAGGCRAGHDIIRQTHDECGASVNIFTAGDQLHGIRQPNDSRCSDRATPPREQAQFHFWKAVGGFFIFGEDAAVAPNRQLRSAANAHAIDCGDRHVVRLRQAAKQLLSTSAKADDFLLGRVDPR